MDHRRPVLEQPDTARIANAILGASKSGETEIAWDVKKTKK
jgi:hypothetical protein